MDTVIRSVSVISSGPRGGGGHSGHAPKGQSSWANMSFSPQPKPGPDWAPSCGRFSIRFQGPARRIGAPREESGPLRDVARGGESVPLGFSGPRGPKLKRKQPKPSQKSRNLRGNRQKKKRQGSRAPLTIWAHQKNRAPRPVARRVQWVQLHPLRVPLHPPALRFAPCVPRV